jgi:hypothetical protein
MEVSLRMYKFYGKSYDQCIVKMFLMFVNDGEPTLARTGINVQQVAHKDAK